MCSNLRDIRGTGVELLPDCGDDGEPRDRGAIGGDHGVVGGLVIGLKLGDHGDDVEAELGVGGATVS